jgi:hypothetical protein
MAKLEQITKDNSFWGIIPGAIVSIVDIKWYDTDVAEVVYKSADGSPGTQILYRDSESTLEVVTAGRPWSFTGDGELLRGVSEAFSIRKAHLYDPVLAVHTSGSKAEVTLEIEFRIPNGVPDNVIRIVSENCRTLKLTNMRFAES